jgi:hypothetical protein
MPGYANKQGAPALNEVNILLMLSINPIAFVSHASAGSRSFLCYFKGRKIKMLGKYPIK